MNAPLALDPGVGYTVAIAFALLFAHAALGKWRELGEFRAVLDNYRILPPPLVATAALVVPVLETVVALSLLAAPARPWGAAAGAALLLAYATAIAINLRRGRSDLDCGCAGPADRRPIAHWMVWRNGVLGMVLAVAGLKWSDRALAWTDAITVGGGVAVLVLLYVTLDRLLGQIMPRTAALRAAR